jgi:uncharacterized protein (TIGR00730 family)
MQSVDKQRRRVCVFCGSSPGVNPLYRAEAVDLGHRLGEADLGLVYGGAQVGLIPRALAGVEVAHQGLSKLVVVETMHERKAMMAQEADAFVALPGGFGTLDEFFEILTWAQLGIHTKPCLLVNTAGYFNHLLSFLGIAIDQGFLKPENHAYIHVVSNAGEAIKCMQKLWQTLPVSHVAPEAPAP